MPNWKTYESTVRLLSAIVAAHPELKLNYDVMAKMLNDGTTRVALEHRFRPIKKDAADMQSAIAGQFGQGTSGKAVSTRFERVKKETPWDLSINRGTGDSNGGTPAKATPRKRGPAKNSAKSKAKTKDLAASGGEEEDDDESDFGGSPTKKKSVLNKVKNGRIAKGKAKSINSSFGGVVDDYYDGEDLKNEGAGYGDMMGSFENGNGHAHLSKNSYLNDHYPEYEMDEPYYEHDEA